MLPLLEKKHPILDTLLSKPFTYSKDYINMYNFVRSIHFKQPYQKLLSDIIIKKFGIHYHEQTIHNNYNEHPDLYIHEFKNVLLYCGLPFDDNGNLIFDAIRIYESAPVKNIISGKFIASVGNWYYIFKKLKNFDIQYNKGEYIFSECLSPFGHRLLETITQFWVFDFFPNARMLLAPQSDITEYLCSYCRPFSLEKEQFFSPGMACIFEKLYIPTRSYMHKCYISQAAINIWRKIRDFYAYKKNDSPKKVYLSRKYISGRSLINEDKCEELLKKFGFSIINMEKLSICEQINIIYNAEYVAGPIGSAMHNMVFCDETLIKSVLYLSPNKFRSELAYHNFERSFNRTFNVVYGKTTTKHDEKAKTGSSPWVIDTENLRHAIEQWLV